MYQRGVSSAIYEEVSPFLSTFAMDGGVTAIGMTQSVQNILTIQKGPRGNMLCGDLGRWTFHDPDWLMEMKMTYLSANACALSHIFGTKTLFPGEACCPSYRYLARFDVDLPIVDWGVHGGPRQSCLCYSDNISYEERCSCVFSR